MRRLLGRVMIAIVLLGAAFAARAWGHQLHVQADIQEQFATLRFDGPNSLSAAERAAADYWQGRYDALATGNGAVTRDPDATVLLTVANAGFRAAQRSTAPRQDQVQQLDLVLQSYATALKAPVFLPDAAYNYEYVARMREALARARGANPPAPARSAASTRAGDLPAGPTIHGHPGGPPPSTKGEEFQIITPMEYGDREAQPEPNAGGRPLRKG